MFAEVVSDRGQGPALVYVPGIDGSGELLLGTAARLEQRFRLVRVRYRPGTDPAHDTYRHLAASLIETVALRGIDRMMLLAESFGGAVALRAALDFPDRVAAVALVNAFCHYRRRVRLAASRLTLGVAPDWTIRAGRRLFAARFLFGGPSEAAAIDEFLGRPPRLREGAATAASPETAPLPPFRLDAGYRARLAMIQSLDLRPELERLGQPVALFASSGDRIVESVRNAREMAARLPHAELEILERRGHVVLPLREIDWPDRLERLAQRAQEGGSAAR